MQPTLTDRLEGMHPHQRRILAFTPIVLLALVLALLPPHEGHDHQLLIWAMACFAVIGVLGTALPWHRWPVQANVTMVPVFCLGVALLRESEGGIQTGYYPLLLLPVVWQALYGTRSSLLAVVPMVAATIAVPLAWEDDTVLRASQVRLAVLFPAVTGSVALLLQRLVRDNARLVADLRTAASTDALTGLANRGRWDDLLGGAITHLDRFKSYNDEHGHLAGDDLLRRLSAEWVGKLDPGDDLARWGGEEFALLLPGRDVRAATEVLTGHLGGHTEVGCSAGVTAWVPGQSADDLMREADDLLYAAKAAGRSRIMSPDGYVVLRGRAAAS